MSKLGKYNDNLLFYIKLITLTNSYEEGPFTLNGLKKLFSI